MNVHAKVVSQIGILTKGVKTMMNVDIVSIN